jgi:Uma2 family endonuclease
MASTAITGSAIHEIIEWGGEILVRGLSKEQFYQLAAQYPELRMEREKNGNILFMTPVKGGSGLRGNNLSYYLTDWCKKQKQGTIFSPSTGFDLPGGSIKSPDIAWISSEKMAQLSPEQIEKEFINVVPDFVAELRSESDPLSKLQNKMAKTWIANGVRLAWLIDPYEEKVHIYRADGSIEVVSDFDRQLSGESVLAEFQLDLSEFKLLGK